MMRAMPRLQVAYRSKVVHRPVVHHRTDVLPSKKATAKKKPAKTTAFAKKIAKAKPKAMAQAKVKTANPPRPPPSRLEPVAEWFVDLPNLFLRRPALSCQEELHKKELAQELPDAAQVAKDVSAKLSEVRQKDVVAELSDDELFALIAYTHDLGPSGKRSLYAALNVHLRSRKNASDAITGLPRASPWEGYLYYLALAMIRLSSGTEMTVYRGFKAGKSKLADYRVGRKGQWAGVTSTSRDRSVAATFADRRGTVFRIQLCSSTLMPKGVSFFDFESEVVMAPYTQLRVESDLYVAEDGVKLIDLKALPPEVTVTNDTVEICKAGTKAEKQRLEEAAAAKEAKSEALTSSASL